MSGWNYYAACSAVLEQVREGDPRRTISMCGCGALFLTPAHAPFADECAYCFRRRERVSREAAALELYRRYHDGEIDHPFPAPARAIDSAPAEARQEVLF